MAKGARDVLEQVRADVRNLAGYTTGEQQPGFIKLNTNECAYPPSPRVRDALLQVVQSGDELLRLYPDPSSRRLRETAAALYGVAPEFRLPERPAYEAHGGYSGARASLSSRIRRGRWGFNVFVSYDWLRGVVFDDSPLFQTEHAVVSGIFVSYRLYTRGAQAPVNDDAP